MLKVMLVDDEPEIRAHIKSTIEWEKLSLSLIAEAGDADTAMESAMLYHPQIVVMDICLPGQDGISLATELLQQDPDIKILIISGFQDFSYAQKALSIGVSAYLTKPVVAKEVNSALKKIKDSFQARKEEQQKNFAVNQVLEQNRTMLQQWQLEALMEGNVPDPNQMYQQMRLLDMELAGKYCTVLMVSSEKENDDMLDNGFRSAMTKQHIENKLKEAGFRVYSYFDDEMVLNCLLSSGIRIPEEHLESLCITMRNELKLYFGQSLFLGIGSTMETPIAISTSAKQARFALKHSLMLSEERVVSWFNIKETQSAALSASPQLNRRWLTRMVECIREGQEMSLEKTIDQILTYLHSQSQRREFCVEFLGEISRQCSELGVFLWSSIDYPTTVRQLFGGADTENFKMSLIQLCRQFTQLLSRQDMDANRYLIIKARKYIEDNYADPELSLEQVSNFVGLSRSYFCSLFHKIENKTFKEYLMDLRIRHAKRMLTSTDKKIYEISCEVGCSDAAYFNRLFKRITGMTPLQYRNSGNWD